MTRTMLLASGIAVMGLISCGDDRPEPATTQPASALAVRTVAKPEDPRAATPSEREAPTERARAAAEGHDPGPPHKMSPAELANFHAALNARASAAIDSHR
jgi:hypothetical protein